MCVYVCECACVQSAECRSAEPSSSLVMTYYSVLHCVAVCCSVLQCAAVCCSVLQRVAVCCSVLQYAAVCCSVLQCVAVCCNCHLHLQRLTSSVSDSIGISMGWLRLEGSFKLWVSFAKEPCKRDYILQKRPITLKSLQIVATP